MLEIPSAPKNKKTNSVSPRAPELNTARRQRMKENLPKQPSFEPIVPKKSAPPKLNKLSKMPSVDIYAKSKYPATKIESPMLKKNQSH